MIFSKKFQLLTKLSIKHASTATLKHRSKIMRQVYLKVHPDLYHNFNDARVFF